MKPVNSADAAAWSPSAMVAPSAQASGHELLKEGFDNVSGLSGWALVNNSAPAGDAWFQGNPAIFAARTGAADAYAAASFLGAANGSGTVDNWLLTPPLELAGTTVLSFCTRHSELPGFNDMLEVRFAPGPGLDPAGFGTVLTTLGGAVPYPADWEECSVALYASGTGRFAFRYCGPADTLNYIGLDSVRVVTALAEAPACAIPRHHKPQA